jgi:hypothetical protein
VELEKSVADWKPDVIVNDFEPLTARLAVEQGVWLWSCTPLHLLDGTVWELGHLKRPQPLRKAFSVLRRIGQAADRKLVYTPFCDLRSRPVLREGYEWVTPYSKEPDRGWFDDERAELLGFELLRKEFGSRLFMTMGETCPVADAIYHQRQLCCVPYSNDPESLLNSILCDYFRIGLNFGDVAERPGYARDQMERFKGRSLSTNYLSKQESWGKLHEKLEDEFQ